MIVLLRGINVGGRNKVSMAVLRAIAIDCGFPDAVTYVQSGNLVLPSAAGSLAAIAAELRGDLQERTGLDVPLILRTFDEWSDVIASNPFPEAAADGTTLHVVFLAGTAPGELTEFDASEFAPEQVALGDREVYLSLPAGIGRSKLAQALSRRPGASTGTTRNWNTVLKLAALATQ